MENNLEARMLVIEDKLAIQELTNSYLFAADRKDGVEMASHFTEDGTLTSIMGEDIIKLDGRKGISDGFAHILAPIKIAYHMAGQLQTTTKGDIAVGTSYCFVTLVGSENYIHKIWAVYNDEYVKNENKWLIKKRIATVAWQEKENFKK